MSVDSWSALTVDEVPAEARSLVRVPTYVPEGWKLSKIVGQTAKYRGTKQVLGITLDYERAGYFPIRVSRAPVTDQPFNVVNSLRDTKHALTLSDINGIKAVMTHQAPGARIQAKMQIMFIEGGAYTSVWWPAGDFDELTRVAASLTPQQSGGTQ